MNSKGLDYFALVVTIIGAINWGLIGFFKFDLVAFLFGQMSWISRIVYAVVGLCGLYLISLFVKLIVKISSKSKIFYIIKYIIF